MDDREVGRTSETDRSAHAGPGPDRAGTGGTMFAAMRTVAFRWLWSTTLAHSSGRFAVMMVAGWLAFRLTGSAIGAGLTALLAFLPALAVGPIAGALADRMDRRRLIQVGAAVAAACCLVVAAFAAAGRLDLDLVLLVALASGVGVAIAQPARTSLVSSVSAPEDLLNAFALLRIPMQGAEMVGPALATVALVRLGPAAGMLVCALLYLLAVLQAPYIVAPPRTEELGAETGIVHSLREAMAYVRGEPRLSSLLVWVWLH